MTPILRYLLRVHFKRLLQERHPANGSHYRHVAPKPIKMSQSALFSLLTTISMPNLEKVNRWETYQLQQDQKYCLPTTSSVSLHRRHSKNASSL